MKSHVLCIHTQNSYYQCIAHCKCSKHLEKSLLKDSKIWLNLLEPNFREAMRTKNR